MRFKIIFFFFVIYLNPIFGQDIQAVIQDSEHQFLENVRIGNLRTKVYAFSNQNGFVQIGAMRDDTLVFTYEGFEKLKYIVSDSSFNHKVKILMVQKTREIDDVTVYAQQMKKFDVGVLPYIKGTQITTGTNAVIELEQLSGAKSSANPREMFAKIPGLNIWESDGAGIQIGIGGRGLSPNRAANFNTRQNGYDISADALGYPESYYTPPFEALKSIEIIRGSASLQFGTQFGGLLNFIIKDAPLGTPLEFTTRNTVGNYGYLGTFNRLAGTHKRIFFQTYYQYKLGEGYRNNSEFDQQQLFAQIGYYFNPNFKIKLEYTHMDYLAQQAGGLTDFQFANDPRTSFRSRNWFQVKWNVLALHLDYDFKNKILFNVRAFGMNSTREALGFLGKVTQVDPMTNRELIQGTFENGGLEMRFLKKYKFNNEKEHRNIKGAMLVGTRAYKGQTTANQGSASSRDDADFRFNNPNDLENSAYSFPSLNFAAFAENILFFGSKWMLNIGARYEYIESASEGFYNRYSIHPLNGDTLGVYKIHEANGVKRNVLLFGGGLGYKPKETLTLYANFTENYRAINFSDIRISNPNIIIDSMINDEFGYTFELGYRGLVQRCFTFDVALFYVFYGDKIGLAPKQGTIYKERTNIGDATNVGIESYMEIEWLDALNFKSNHKMFLFLNTAYINAHYIRSKESNYIGNEVEYVSPIIFKSGFKWQFKGFTTQVQMSHNTRQYSDASNAVEPSGDAVVGLVPAYTVFDFSARFQAKRNFQFELGVNNFTNVSYFTRRATAYPGPGIIPSDGIGIYGTVQYQFKLKSKKYK